MLFQAIIVDPNHVLRKHFSDIKRTNYNLHPWAMGVVGILRLEAQTKESARRDKRPSPGYCVAICFYYAALGHMFLLCGARPYVSIGWLWAWG